MFLLTEPYTRAGCHKSIHAFLNGNSLPYTLPAISSVKQIKAWPIFFLIALVGAESAFLEPK